MRQKFDLHMHSTRSDGQHDVKTLFEMVRERGIHTFSITDHDNVESIHDMAEIDHELKYIPGVEITSIFQGKYKMHILGYYVDPDCTQLLDVLKDIKKMRVTRFRCIREKLYSEHGITLPEDEVDEICRTVDIPGRPHIAELMVKHGYCRNVDEAFDMYLRELRVKAPYQADAQDAIDCLKTAGGTVLWAHPKNVETADRINADDLAPALIKAGINGIEVYNSLHSYEDCMRYREIVMKRDLLAGGGSDFHGKEVKGNVHLGGLFKDNIDVEIDINEMTVIR